MKIIFFVCLAIGISACSSQPKQVENTNTDDTVYNTEEPTSFAEYREWRKNNDPASEAYADYREWLINYRKWQRQQEQQQ
ncbi:hypothetical protein ACVBE9_09600 [Eionea flava]